MTCPACNHTRGNRRYDEKKIGLSQVYRCKKCSAVFGSCYKGDSYNIVLPSFHPVDVPPDETFYYDLEVLGSAGIERRHGWAHKESKRIVQVG